ncbi:MAG: hypothetical protein KatS3mg110_1775 [Pirellulaceae bacterium]|nr:MAG: hypothetical protein KatS3mg110_1775 [Pirellulaceae bacterium]
MLTIITEQPWTLLLCGLFVTAVLFFFWTQFARPFLFYAMIIALLVTGLLIGFERLWVTDREAVVGTLYQIARDVKQDNLPRLLEYIAPEAVAIRQLAESEYHRYQVSQLRITRVWEVTVDSQRQPPQAVAKLSVVVRGGFRGATVDEKVMRYVVVYLRRYGQEWKVYSYEHYPPFEAFRREPSSSEPVIPELPAPGP